MPRRHLARRSSLLGALGLTAVACACSGGEPAEGADAGRADAAVGTSTSSLRHARRLSAAQLRASLRVATGREWADYDARAASLGEADHLTRLTDSLDISIPFLRFAEDGARSTCAEAVVAERALAPGGERAILGAVDLAGPTSEQRATNLARLLLRFHGHVVSDASDPRLAMWSPVLDAPADDVSPEEAEAHRWEAVCIGLVMHSDFLTY